jgi:hypothetical protein
MGSYNLSCGISRLTIRCGNPVVFLPLVPNVYGEKNEDPDIEYDILNYNPFDFVYKNLVGTSCNLIYPYDYFWPLCLPIFGTYNDYGGVENIVENDTTKALEVFFEAPIQDIIDQITGSEGEVTSKMKYVRKSYRSDFALTPKGLQEINFQKKSIGDRTVYYLPERPKYLVELFKRKEQKYHQKDWNYRLYREDVLLAESMNDDHYHVWDDFVSKYQKPTMWVLNVKPEHQDKYKMLTRMSGMFILKDIYDDMTEWGFSTSDHNDLAKNVISGYPSVKILLELGFEKIDIPGFYDPHHKTLMRYPGCSHEIKVGDYGSSIVPVKSKEYIVFSTDRKGLERDFVKSWNAYIDTPIEEVFPEIKDIKKNDVDKETMAKIYQYFTEKTGLLVGWSRKAKSVFTLRDVGKIFEEVAGLKLDLSNYENKSQFMTRYDELQAELKAWKAKEGKTTKRKYVVPSIEEQKRTWDIIQDIKASMGKKKETEFKPKEPGTVEYYEDPLNDDFDDPLGRFKDPKALSMFKDYNYFKEIYRETLMNSREFGFEMEKWTSFYWAMYSTNTFFFPSFSGKQDGDNEASKKLLLKSIEIVHQRLREEYEEDD